MSTQAVGRGAATQRLSRHPTANRQSAVDEESTGIPTTSPTMTRGSVAREAIEAARVEFLRQLREWERRDHDDEEEDAEGEEEEEVLPNIRVEIARGVTPRMAARIPAEWLVGLAVELLPNGVLELVDVETAEHNEARAHVGVILGQYAFTNNLRSPYPYPDDFDYASHRNHPDGVLLQRVNPRPAPRVPILVVEVEVKHRSIPKLIEIATEYLQRESIQSVVGLKIFRAYERVYRNEAARLRKPALALVFERVPDQQVAPFAIRIAQEVSFGSQWIHGTVRANISDLPTRTQPATPNNPRVIQPSPFEPLQINPLDVEASFPLMNPHVLVVPAPNFNLPAGANPLPDLTFDLRAIFQSALRGWEDDQDDRDDQ